MTERNPCPVCATKSGHHRADCTNKGKRRGRKSKAPEDRFVRLMVSLPPEMAGWLHSRQKAGTEGISATVQRSISRLPDYPF